MSISVLWFLDLLFLLVSVTLHPSRGKKRMPDLLATLILELTGNIMEIVHTTRWLFLLLVAVLIELGP